MVYGIGGQAMEDTSVVWVDRTGKTTKVFEKLANYTSIRLSPDGTQLAVGIWESTSSVNNIWTYDFQRGTLSRLTFSENADFSPTWSPDGTKIYFSSTRNNSIPNIYVKSSNGSGTAERVTESQDAQIVSDLSPDANTILFHQESASTEADLMAVNLVDKGKPRILLQTPFKERMATVSPDGNWIAFESNESAVREIYVRSFKNEGRKWQISTDGGRDPLWSPNGKELFFRMGDTIMTVPVTTEHSSFRAGAPEPLFKLDWGGGLGLGMYFDIAPDGERFIALKQESPKEKIDRAHLRFVFNWFDEVTSRVPIR
jgi:Tol biopolymer transport system component